MIPPPDFIGLYFETGTAKPHPDKVFNKHTHQDENNPRQEHQIERNSQTYALIHIPKQEILFSSFTQKTVIKTYLCQKTKKNIVIKDIIDRDKFLDGFKSLNNVYLSAVPTFFSTKSEATLAEILNSDPFNTGIDVKQIRLKVLYDINVFNEKIKSALLNWVMRKKKNDMNKLTITGQTDENFERVFNAEGVVDKVKIEATLGDSGLCDAEEVFQELIEKVK